MIRSRGIHDANGIQSRRWIYNVSIVSNLMYSTVLLFYRCTMMVLCNNDARWVCCRCILYMYPPPPFFDNYNNRSSKRESKEGTRVERIDSAISAQIWRYIMIWAIFHRFENKANKLLLKNMIWVGLCQIYIGFIVWSSICFRLTNRLWLRLFIYDSMDYIFILS